jgi:hypothetical protein
MSLENAYFFPVNLLERGMNAPECLIFEFGDFVLVPNRASVAAGWWCVLKYILHL